jgi:alcohol dehydrogenase class IV
LPTTDRVQIPSTFSFGTPSSVVFGNGAVAAAGENVSAWGARRVMLIADKAVADAGLLARLEESLESVDIAWETLSVTAGEPTDRSVQAAVDAARELRPDAILAMGGGSSMDTAKATSAIVENGGSVLEYLRRERKIERAGVPVAAITTTSGTGAEVTPISVITEVDRRWKGGLSGPFLMPRLAICDPELTLGLPSAVTANTGIDALTHCIECYANSTFHPYAKALALEGIRVIGQNLRRAVSHGADLSARWGMMWGANLGGLCIARAGTGDVHAFAGPISGMFGVAHGRALAILLPHIMAFSLPGAVDAYADVAEALGETVDGVSRIVAAERGVEAVRRLLADCPGALRLSECGVSENDITALTEDGFSRGDRTINPRAATRDDVEAIYRAAL